MSVRPLLPMLVLFALACGSDSTGPGGGGGPTSYSVKLEVSSVIVREMCDGFPVDVNGGEWSYRLEGRFPGEGTTVMGGNSGYPNPNAYTAAGRGTALPLSAEAGTITRVLDSEDGDQVTLTIRATEWDYDIFGNNPYPDERMDNRTVTATFKYTDGAWPDHPAGVLTLQNTTSCIVDVNYTFEAVKK